MYHVKLVDINASDRMIQYNIIEFSRTTEQKNELVNFFHFCFHNNIRNKYLSRTFKF